MIPIIIKDYTWRQTGDMIYVTVKIKGIKASKPSFVTGDNYIRLHCQPYYFELFLWEKVDDCSGKCQLNEKEGLVVFELPKALPNQEWPYLTLQKDLTRAEKHEIRSKAVETCQKKAVDSIQTALARRQEQSQMTIREQLRLDSLARERIASIKSFHAETALNDLNEWKKETKGDGEDADDAKEEDSEDASDPVVVVGPGGDGRDDNLNLITTTTTSSTNPVSTRENVEDSAASAVSSSSVPQEVIEPKQGKQSTKSSSLDNNIWTEKDGHGKTGARTTAGEIPGIRQAETISVSFTPREFSTPARESKAAEEEEWLKKQMEARRKSGFNDEDLRPEERNPVWLYEKGESLMQNGSYLGAISAFSTGIKMNPKIPEFYGARAQAHLALSNIRKAVEDSSEGLELLTPKVSQNATDRARCHRVRGDAFYKLKMYEEAARDYREVVKICPEDIKDKEMLDSITDILDKKMVNGDDGSSSSED